jgi:hypothetical protein
MKAGPRCRIAVSDMVIGTKSLNWVPNITYLGVKFNANSSLQVDCYFVNRKFYSALHSVLNGCKYAAENVKLFLVKSYCLPILTYCIGALELSNASVRNIGVCWNDAFRKIYGVNRWESVTLLQWFCKEPLRTFMNIYDQQRWNFNCNIYSSGSTPLPVRVLQNIVSAEHNVLSMYSLKYNLTTGFSVYERKRAIEMFVDNICICRLNAV